MSVMSQFCRRNGSHGAATRRERKLEVQVDHNAKRVPGRGHAPGGALTRMFDLGFDPNDLAKCTHEEIVAITDTRAADRAAEVERAKVKAERDLIVRALRLITMGKSVDDIRANPLFGDRIADAIALTL